MTEIQSRVNLLEKNKNKITRQKLRSAFDVFFAKVPFCKIVDSFLEVALK